MQSLTDKISEHLLTFHQSFDKNDTENCFVRNFLVKTIDEN
jgi:hypothetical protein